MTDVNQADVLLVQQIRKRDAGAWEQLIAKYEGRLLAFAKSRLHKQSAAEDVVQETFIGFLTSLPNFDERRRLESYLFSICAYKLTDQMRREFRRPALPFSTAQGSDGESLHLADMNRGPSTIMRQDERRELEEQSLANALTSQVRQWMDKGYWDKVKCVELLFVRGRGNKQVAEQLGMSEQKVANIKFEFLDQLRKSVRTQSLSADVFPELYEA